MTFGLTLNSIVDARAVYGPAKGILDDGQKPISQSAICRNFVSNCYTICTRLYVHSTNSCKMRRLQPIMAGGNIQAPEDS